MKVKTLIERLQRCNQNAEVRYSPEEAIGNRKYKVMAEGWGEEDPAGIEFQVDEIVQGVSNNVVYLCERWEEADDWDD